MKWCKWEEKNSCIAKLEQTGTLGSLYNYIETFSLIEKKLKVTNFLKNRHNPLIPTL